MKRVCKVVCAVLVVCVHKHIIAHDCILVTKRFLVSCYYNKNRHALDGGVAGQSDSIDDTVG